MCFLNTSVLTMTPPLKFLTWSQSCYTFFLLNNYKKIYAMIFFFYIIFCFRALYSLGPDVGCYAPPKLYENEHKESLQVFFSF